MSTKELRTLLGSAGTLLLAYALTFSQSAFARQNQKAQDKAESSTKASAQQTGGEQTSAATTTKIQTDEAKGEASESTVARGENPGNGSHEGIKVHGHWTIEVRNPNGAMVRHVEFENSLNPGYSYTKTLGAQTVTVQEIGGGAYLAALLTGAATTPTGWGIILGGPAGLSSPLDATNAPCVDPLNSIAQCFITIPPPAGAPCASSESCNLMVSALGTSPALTAIQLTGSVQATQNGLIATVETGIFNTCTNLAVSQCALGNAHIVTNAMELDRYSFTSSTNFPGAPISVSAGQTIAVTVTISFS